jgi:asparagine synthase (glutamine-hydrolysing)
MWHRGPDGVGAYSNGPVWLGHRRLAIVDVESGSQPMCNEDRSIWITYNGEIYNHRSLRPMLERLGHRYRTESDTETIVHLYEEFGVKGVERLRGMFAFAIWDEHRHRLVLVRDRLGVKPLYYTVTADGSIYFASEIKALIEAGAVQASINHAALPDYLANRSTSGEETLFAGVKRLPPGHVLTWDDGKIELSCYWAPDWNQKLPRLSDDEYVERFGELFDESVRMRLMADVPLGMFLSGGIDSSAIAAAMSGMVDGSVKTFSVAFEEREANELEYARLVSRAFHTDHFTTLVSPAEFFAALPGLVYHEDEPIAYPSSVPLFFVSQLAAHHVKVVLTGEGSDELLAGYGKYVRAFYNLRLAGAYGRVLPSAARELIASTLRGLAGASSIGAKLRRSFLCLEPSLQAIYFDNFGTFSESSQHQMLTPEAKEKTGNPAPYGFMFDLYQRSGARDLLDRLLAIDLGTYLQELLMKQDQMSMAASIESRVPFLDHHLVEFACALPPGMKLRGLTTKYILRRAMRNRLPRQILTRRKMGFPVPVGAWLRGRYASIVDEYLLSERAARRGLFRQDYVRELVSRHRAGENHADRLWMLINFELWQRLFIDKEGPDVVGDGAAALGALSQSPDGICTSEKSLGGPVRIQPGKIRNGAFMNSRGGL